MSKRKILLSLLFIIHLIIPVLANIYPQMNNPLMTYGKVIGLSKRWNFFPNVLDTEYVLYFTGDEKVIPGNISRENWFIQNFLNGNHIDFYATLSKNPERMKSYMEFLCRKFQVKVVKAELIIRPLEVNGPEERKTFRTEACP